MRSLPRHPLHSAQQAQVKVAVLADTLQDRPSLSWQDGLIAGVAIAAILLTYLHAA